MNFADDHDATGQSNIVTFCAERYHCPEVCLKNVGLVLVLHKKIDTHGLWSKWFLGLSRVSCKSILVSAPTSWPHTLLQFPLVPSRARMLAEYDEPFCS